MNFLSFYNLHSQWAMQSGWGDSRKAALRPPEPKAEPEAAQEPMLPPEPNLSAAIPAPEADDKPTIWDAIQTKGQAYRRKLRLWEETQGSCIYCGASIPMSDFMNGVGSDIEHIIPAALGGTSRFENLACSCRACNRDKGDLTAIDFMLSKTSEDLLDYLKRLRLLATAGLISAEKYANLTKPKALLMQRL